MLKRIVQVMVALTFISVTHAQARRPTEVTFSGKEVVPQLVDGGSWKTIITLVNLDTKVATYTLRFYADSGQPLSLDTNIGNGTTLVGTIPYLGSKTIETPGIKGALSQGWALVDTQDVIGGTAIFRQIVPGRPDFEASQPLVSYLDNERYALPFDGITSDTGIALVNNSSSSTANVFLTFRDENGSQITLDSLTLPPLNHVTMALNAKYPTIVGKRGTLELLSSNIYVTVLGLRFAGAAFTSITPLISSKW